jgi:hypothetical protein
MKLLIQPLAIITIIFLASCGKHTYIIKASEINRYAKAAKEDSPAAFVVYKNGDTLKASSVKKKRSVINGKESWVADGKKISPDNIVAYQDKYGYRQGEYSRLLKGRMNMYVQQIDNSSLQQRYNSVTKQYESTMVGHTQTSFFMGEGSAMESVTFNTLTKAMSKCPDAARQMQTEFGNSVWKKDQTTVSMITGR